VNIAPACPGLNQNCANKRSDFNLTLLAGPRSSQSTGLYETGRIIQTTPNTWIGGYQVWPGVANVTLINSDGIGDFNIGGTNCAAFNTQFAGAQQFLSAGSTLRLSDCNITGTAITYEQGTFVAVRATNFISSQPFARGELIFSDYLVAPPFTVENQGIVMAIAISSATLTAGSLQINGVFNLSTLLSVPLSLPPDLRSQVRISTMSGNVFDTTSLGSSLLDGLTTFSGAIVLDPVWLSKPAVAQLLALQTSPLQVKVEWILLAYESRGVFPATSLFTISLVPSTNSALGTSSSSTLNSQSTASTTSSAPSTSASTTLTNSGSISSKTSDLDCASTISFAAIIFSLI
jgi:hypothetical protein